MSKQHKSFSAKETRLKQWTPIALILLLALVLRLYQLDTEGLWFDEMLSIHRTENFNIEHPGQRPLYFVLLSFWMRLGTSDAWLRSLAVVFGIGSVFLTYQLGLRVTDKRGALIAALLMALSPLFLWHSQEIRYYTLSTFMTLAGTLAMVNALEYPSRLSLGCWAITRLLAILTTPLNVLLLLPDTILFGWKFRQRRRWLLAFGVGLIFIGVIWLPIALELATVSGPEYMSSWASETPKPSITNIIARLTAFTVFWPPAVLKSKDASPITFGYYQIYTLVLVGLLATALFYACKVRHRSQKLLWIAAWALIPASSILIISYMQSSIWLDRYLLFVTPYLFILLAVGFWQIWHWKRQLAAVLVVLYAIAITGGLGNYYTVLYRDNWSGAVQAIRDNEQPEDIIVYHSVWPYPEDDKSLARYYDGDLPVYNIDSSHQDGTLVSYPAKPALSDIASTDSRLWLVCWGLGKNKEEIQLIEETVAGKQFQVDKVWASNSPITDSLEVFLVTPD